VDITVFFKSKIFYYFMTKMFFFPHLILSVADVEKENLFIISHGLMLWYNFSFMNSLIQRRQKTWQFLSWVLKGLLWYSHLGLLRPLQSHCLSWISTRGAAVSKGRENNNCRRQVQSKFSEECFTEVVLFIDMWPYRTLYQD
jgi:hypothetical protein